MKVTLQVNGREMTFSEQELSSILGEHFSSKTTWFEVKPQAIDQKLFEKKRNNKRQEETRQLILEAFAEMKNNPEKYGKNFKTRMPQKRWSSKTAAQLIEMASNLGDHNANWVEQALEWAQRIANGESWEAICNDKDTADWYRLVVWKKGKAWRVGGSVHDDSDSSASNVDDYGYLDGCSLYNAVPLVVLYE